MAEIISLERDMCVQCPQCNSQLFYCCVEKPGIDYLTKIECGGFDEHGEPCDYNIVFEEEDGIELILDEDE